jgi:hypothetical protein
MSGKKFLPADAHTVGIIYVKPLEMNAITVMLDEEYELVPLANLPAHPLDVAQTHPMLVFGDDPNGDPNVDETGL